MRENAKPRVLESGAYKGRSFAVYTSGGDSQGMNAALRAIVRMGLFLGCKPYFILEGYQGMVDGGNSFVEAHWNSVSSIIHKGGTIIGSARCMEFRERPGRLKAAKNLINRNINSLVVIGGDGSLTGANLFRTEWKSLVAELLQKDEVSGENAKNCQHLSIVGLVGSIDNDFCGTDMTIGVDSALFRILEAIDAIIYTASSHQRTFILEIMGRNCGYLSIAAGLLSAANAIFIPEDPPEKGWEAQLCQRLLKERESGKRLNIIIVSEGAIDREGNKITCEQIKKIVVDNLNQDTRITVLGHIQRGGNPSAFDRILASRMGVEAVLALMEESPDEEPTVIVYSGLQLSRFPLMEGVKITQEVTKAMKNLEWERAKDLRGSSFKRQLYTYKMLHETKGVEHSSVASAPIFNVGIVHIGAPACGMNSAVRTIVRLAIHENITIFGIHDGIEGLIQGLFQPMQWSDVANWVGEGGALLGTKRMGPRGRFQSIARELNKNGINGLIIIGGFEAFEAALDFIKEREKYEAFCIPIIVIPATISNNVPGTDYTLGCDTALNEIVNICDTIRQSAQGTKRRVFIVETMGGHCGYLATLAGLAGGADTAYIYEEKFSIMDLQKDLYHMACKMAEGVQRGLILRSEKCNDNYDCDFMTKLYSEEGKGVYSARKAILGHMQQGGNSSPFDRNWGIKLSVAAFNWMFQELKKCTKEPGGTITSKDPNTVGLLGIRQKEFTVTPIRELEKEADLVARIPKVQWWLSLRPLLQILGKHDSLYEEETVYVTY